MITLPANFEADIQGQNLNLYPVVIIAIDSTGTNPDLHLSTKEVKLGSRHFKPLLLNIPSVKESMDFENRNYRISSVNLKISNFEFEGERFSDYPNNLQGTMGEDFPGSLINVAVKIYWISQSFPSNHTIGFDNDGDAYALQVYKGFIRRYSHDDETVTFQLEDSTQKDLHKEVPIRRVGTDANVLDRYKNQAVPMVYGEVDNSPLVVTEYVSNGEVTLLADDIDRVNVEIIADEWDNTNVLKVYNGLYNHVLKVSANYQHWGYSAGGQYEHTSGEGILTFLAPNIQSSTSQQIFRTPIEENVAEVVQYLKPDSHKLFQGQDNVNFQHGSYTHYYYYYADTPSESNVPIGVEYWGANFDNKEYRIDYYFESNLDDLYDRGHQTTNEEGDFIQNKEERVISTFDYGFHVWLDEFIEVAEGETFFGSFRVLMGYDTTYEGNYTPNEAGNWDQPDAEGLMDVNRPGMQIMVDHAQVPSNDYQNADLDTTREGLAGFVGGGVGVGEGFNISGPKLSPDGQTKLTLYMLYDYRSWPNAQSSQSSLGGLARMYMARLKLRTNFLIKNFRGQDFYASVNGRTDLDGVYE